ncbi:VOC family protein [Exiguobacterium sp. s129]|uniref:VOC family protein n=1 Tax=Exiguobacterium sp. s129 TaxID=2751264 RepID=UPI001BEAE05A|nr:VOC family protein [Exiguobacterium sp. s129]
MLKKLVVGKEASVCVYQTGSTQLGLIQTSSPQAATFKDASGQAHVYFNVICEDIQFAYQSFEQAGLIATPLHDFGGMSCFDVVDPDGHTISLISEDMTSPFHRNRVNDLQTKGKS